MRFEWDEDKRVSNRLKHRVDFKLAQSVFQDSFASTFPDRIVDGEERWRTVGQTPSGLLLTIIHTTWFEDDEEVIRIISARKATPHERRDYSESGFQDY